QDGLLLQKSLVEIVRRPQQDLDGEQLRVPLAAFISEIDDSHAARTDLAHNSIRPYAVAFLKLGGVRLSACGQAQGMIEQRMFLVIGRKHLIEHDAEFKISLAGLAEPSRAGGGRHVRNCLEQFAYSLRIGSIGRNCFDSQENALTLTSVISRFKVSWAAI